ncbi:class I adenylate-forming enzyme family protein [Sulfitobacter mediterraneus]|uniref:Long-chain fatty acid--CoA ligase n=1 Tax=Sulfitobacter mediterraneus TaxID=83219 RepID=A0A061SW82_9RHOB|nr:class I adenylate-forming enzyme family protein [Sulfitobacter mediterraneus]KAJ04168.1 long-chain fatty acid--CoA ligase [Sulfitobacter mediterraneus]
MQRVEDFLADQVQKAPDALSLTDSIGTRWSFADLDAASTDLAGQLTKAGVQANDRVLMLSENCAAAVAVLFACWKLDAVVIPVNARQSATEVDRVVTHASPAAVLMTSAVSPEATVHADRMQAQEITGTFGTLQLATPMPSQPDPDLSDVAVLLYTTGTTGDPKGVMLTHDNLRFGGKASASLRNMTPSDLIYGVLPITHVFGLASVVTASCYAGASVRLEARFSGAKLFEALNEGVTLLSAVPQMHALLMQYTKEQGLDRLGSPDLRYVSSGAAPLDPAWKRKAEAFYGIALQNGYGMTETTAGVCASNNSIGSPDISVGPCLPGVEVMIDDSVAGGHDGTGEVLTRGAHIMKGYYRNPEETAKVLSSDGWMRTGDLGKIDKNGFLHILGRSKELIIHGGFNVYPPEVEAAINDHPQVIQSAVIGRMKDGDEQVLAFVQIAEGDNLTAAELRDFVRDRLTGYKRPAQIILGTALPAAPTGKILKHKLLDTFADQLA